MRMTWPALLVCTALVAAVGCSASKPAEGADAPGGTPAQIRDVQTRLEAALLIGSAIRKDEALAAVCVDAAKCGASDTVLKGLKAVSSTLIRDNVAYECALILGDGGLRQPAIEVAKLIGSSIKRDEALRKLATG